MSSSRISIAALLALMIAAFSTPQGASAHTRLISSTPEVGVTLNNWPTQVKLEFDQALVDIGQEKSNFVVVNNSLGDQVSQDDEVINENVISVSLTPNEVKGPVLVFYRVVSADGHPVEGEFAFNFSEEQSAEVDSINQEQTTDFPLTIYIASAAFIASGIFFAIYSYRRRNLG
jgi:methionine-rich copper-binding protein CopC